MCATSTPRAASLRCTRGFAKASRNSRGEREPSPSSSAALKSSCKSDHILCIHGVPTLQCCSSSSRPGSGEPCQAQTLLCRARSGPSKSLWACTARRDAPVCRPPACWKRAQPRAWRNSAKRISRCRELEASSALTGAPMAKAFRAMRSGKASSRSPSSCTKASHSWGAMVLGLSRPWRRPAGAAARFSLLATCWLPAQCWELAKKP
mmetsp:Transcript_106563/g.343828  ORF Transcript_106563/g.343828 Transcript_106563/m.343828 type:complete len:207 (-) Transcript_106563:224-844(-)